MDYELFLSPGRIGTLELNNRCVFPPMGGMLCTEEGFVTDRFINYHVRRVQGGCGMNIIENTATHYSSYNRWMPNIWDEKFEPGLKKLTAAIHEAGGKICVQLAHNGRQDSGKHRGMPQWAPSAIPCPFTQEMPVAVTKEQIDQVVEGFRTSADRAIRCGFDAIEIHAAHGYLLDEFLNPYSNIRTDEYGGSLENRARIVIDIIKTVRKEVGKDFPVILRMNASENVEGGITIEDAKILAMWFKEAGVDALDISQGCYTHVEQTTPPYWLPEKYNAANAGVIRRLTGLPVICAGRVSTPEQAEEILEAGDADFVSLGRAQICDPDFVKKTAEDRPDEIVHCIHCCSGCVESVFSGNYISCVFRAESGHEGEYSYAPAETPKNILVIGGGVAGLEAARIAAERGHKVTLFEKSGMLGGQFLIAGTAPHKAGFRNSAIEMGYRAMRAGVDVRINTEATPARIKAVAPDHIIVAAGSAERILKLEGDLPVYHAREVLTSSVRVKEQTVVVLGGGMTGLEAAEVLTEEGKKAVVVEMLDVIGKDLEYSIRPYMENYIKEHGIETYASTNCIRLEKDGMLVKKDGKEFIIPCEAVVTAVGSVRNAAIEEMVKETGIPYDVVGDAARPGKMLTAVWKANEVARNI